MVLVSYQSDGWLKVNLTSKLTKRLLPWIWYKNAILVKFWHLVNNRLTKVILDILTWSGTLSALIPKQDKPWWSRCSHGRWVRKWFFFFFWNFRSLTCKLKANKVRYQHSISTIVIFAIKFFVSIWYRLSFSSHNWPHSHATKF